MCNSEHDFRQHFYQNECFFPANVGKIIVWYVMFYKMWEMWIYEDA